MREPHNKFRWLEFGLFSILIMWGEQYGNSITIYDGACERHIFTIYENKS